jgi:hypothetical protein
LPAAANAQAAVRSHHNVPARAEIDVQKSEQGKKSCPGGTARRREFANRAKLMELAVPGINRKEDTTMRVISATILDAKHLELSQPLDESPGEVIQISLPTESDDELAVWRHAAKQHILDAYAHEDAIYDDL